MDRTSDGTRCHRQFGAGRFYGVAFVNQGNLYVAHDAPQVHVYRIGGME